MGRNSGWVGLTVAVGTLVFSSIAEGQEPMQRFTMQSGMHDGSVQAESVGTGRYFGGGFASGLLLPGIGILVPYALASSSDVHLPPEIQLSLADHPVEYVQGYRESYERRVKDKRRRSGLLGGMLGTGTVVVFSLLVLAASS